MLRRILVLSLISLLIVGCGDDTGPDAELVGTWHLESVDSQALPWVLDEPGVDKLEVTEEIYTLREGGLFSMTTTFRVTDAGAVSSETVPDNGTYTVDGSTVTFTYASDGSTDIAAIDNVTMTLDDIGHTFVYRRD